MDNQTVDTTLQACNFDIDLTIEKLQQLCLSSANNPPPPPPSPPPEPPRQPPLSDKDAKWVDFFVEEMLCATDIEDARSRAARALAARDQDYHHHQVVKTDNRQVNEKANTRLAQENIVLKRFVVLQHEKLKEREANHKKEVENLNNIISKYRDEIRVLELNNYSLRVHLNHPNSSLINASNLPPDVY